MTAKVTPAETPPLEGPKTYGGPPAAPTMPVTAPIRSVGVRWATQAPGQ